MVPSTAEYLVMLIVGRDTGRGATIKSMVLLGALLLRLPVKPGGRAPTVKFPATEPLKVVYLISGNRLVPVTLLTESMWKLVTPLAMRLVLTMLVRTALPST